MRSALVETWRSIRSMEPRKRTPSKMTASCSVLAGSRLGSGGRPKANSKCTGSHSASVAATCCSQPRRSVRRFSISLFQTRGMAGARSSSYFAATRSSTRSARSSVARSATIGKLAGERAEQLELGGVKQRAARKRIHLFERNGLLARAELENGMEREAIGASGEVLERGRRITAVSQAVRVEGLAGGGVGIDEAIGRGPEISPAAAAGSERAGERGIGVHEVAGASGGARAAQFERGLERSEIVFGVVDGLVRARGGGPIEARGSARGRHASRIRGARAVVLRPRE